jgi:hypothetical protein
MKNMPLNFSRTILFAGLFCATAITHASTIYTYQSTEYYPGGVPYEIPTAWVMPVVISFTLASPLRANLGAGFSGYNVASQILSWSAGTGVPGDTITNAMAGTRIDAAEVWTNATGEIYAYNLIFFGPVVGLTNPANELVTAIKYPNQRGQDGVRFERAVNGYNFGSLYTGLYSTSTVTSVSSTASGAGSSSGSSTSVPLPSSIALVLAGLLGTALRAPKKTD